MISHCIEVGKKEEHTKTGVILHGFGASSYDISTVFYQLTPQLPYAIIPQAPVSLLPVLGYDGYAWFPKDESTIQRALQGTMWKQLPHSSVKDIEKAAQDIYILLSERKLLSNPLVIIGFSQGGMVASEFAFLCAQKGVHLHALVLLSSSLVDKRRWENIAISCEKELFPPVFIAHGRDDMVLEYYMGEDLYDFWKQWSLFVEFYDFKGWTWYS